MTRPPIAEPKNAAPGSLAELDLDQRRGRTHLVKCRTRPPLVVQRALHLDESVPDMAFVLLANPTGGLLQNDEQRISIAVGPGAKAHATTQSATKVYSMPTGSARQWLDLTVADGGYLEYLPDPVIRFRLANLSQSINLTVAGEGVIIFQEVITPGRVAMGEAFDYTRLAYRLVLSRPDGHPIYREAFELTPATVRQMGLGVLGAATDPDLNPPLQMLGSMLIVADPSSVQSILTDLRPTLAGCPGVRAGISTLPGNHGLGIKALGADTNLVQGALAAAWSVARRIILGAETPFLRKY